MSRLILIYTACPLVQGIFFFFFCGKFCIVTFVFCFIFDAFVHHEVQDLDGKMADLRFYVLFNSISVISDNWRMIMKDCVQWNPVYD